MTQWSLGIVTRSVWRAREVDDAFSASSVPLTHWDTPIESPEVLSVLQDALDRYPASASVASVRDLIFANLDTEDPDHLSDVEAAMESLASTNAPNFGAAARSLRITNDTRPVQPGAHLLNAHRGKGHQFDWVVVLGLEEKHLPDGRSIDEEALREEEQVLLVMLSRARHGALVTRRMQTMAPWGTNRPRASRWWPLFNEILQSDMEAVLTHVGSLGIGQSGPAMVASGDRKSTGPG